MKEWVDAYYATRDHGANSPPQYAERVWGICRKSLLDPAYYFSYSELLLFAELTDTILVIARHAGSNFEIIGTHTSMRRDPVHAYFSLAGSGGRQSRVRGHFERIWPMHEYAECCVAYELEERMHKKRREQEERFQDADALRHRMQEDGLRTLVAAFEEEDEAKFEAEKRQLEVGQSRHSRPPGSEEPAEATAALSVAGRAGRTAQPSELPAENSQVAPGTQKSQRLPLWDSTASRGEFGSELRDVLQREDSESSSSEGRDDDDDSALLHARASPKLFEVEQDDGVRCSEALAEKHWQSVYELGRLSLQAGRTLPHLSAMWTRECGCLYIHAHFVAAHSQQTTDLDSSLISTMMTHRIAT